MVSLKLYSTTHGGCDEKYGSCVRENDGRRDIRAMVRKEDTGNPLPTVIGFRG